MGSLSTPLPMGSLDNVANQLLVPSRPPLATTLVWERLMAAKHMIAKMETATGILLVAVSYNVAPPLARLATMVLRLIIIKLRSAWSANRTRAIAAARALIPVLQHRLAVDAPA